MSGHLPLSWPWLWGFCRFCGSDWNFGPSQSPGDGLEVGVTVGVEAGEAAGTAGAMRSAGGLGLGIAVTVRARLRLRRVLWKCVVPARIELC